MKEKKRIKVQEDITGQRFGKLTVICQTDDYISPSGNRLAQWLCKCDCGNETIAIGGALHSGEKRSCGCLRKEAPNKRRAHPTSHKRIKFYTPDNVYIARVNTKRITEVKEFKTFEEAVEQCKVWDRILHPCKREEKNKTCTDYCADCKYMKRLDHYHEIMYCDYYMMKEERRPCCAGDECTVKEERAEDHDARVRTRYGDDFIHTKSLHKLKRERVNKNLEYTGNNC